MVRIKKDRRGFSLVEIMIVCLFLVIIVFGFIYLFNVSLYLNEQTRNSIIAINDAVAVVERIKNIEPFSVTNLIAGYPDAGYIAGYNNLDSESVQVNYGNLAADPVLVTVTVTWQGKERIFSEEVSTFVTKR